MVSIFEMMARCYYELLTWEFGGISFLTIGFVTLFAAAIGIYIKAVTGGFKK